MPLKSAFVCQNCGSQSPKWQGKCPDCDSWNSFVEEKFSEKRFVSEKPAAKPLLLDEVALDTRPVPTLEEVDRVLDGGLVPGSLLLLGGSPGIGKSTLLLQVAGRVAEERKVLYVSGEESEAQTRRRAERLGIRAPGLYLLHEINLDVILTHLRTIQPSVAVLDSIQTVYKEDVASAPGSVTQVRECAGELLRWSKNLGITIVLVGHVTKDGSIAGPRVLEHIVDTVLYLEGEDHQAYRMLRAFKHRFGSTSEVGIFEMTGQGLSQVKNPSELFLQSRADTPGSVVVPILEGQRPLLMELQALVSRSWYGIPKRAGTGVDFNRMGIILAVLEKRCRVNLGQSDVYMNVVGALKIREPAADLAMAMAVVSSVRDSVVSPDCIVLGEVGLGGEVRAVPYFEERLREAAQVGFKHALVPASNLKREGLGGLRVAGVRTLQEAVDALFAHREERR